MPLLGAGVFAGIGTAAVALITSWSLLSLSKLPFEIALLGPRFSLVRISRILFMPLIAGFLPNFSSPAYYKARHICRMPSQVPDCAGRQLRDGR